MLARGTDELVASIQLALRNGGEAARVAANLLDTLFKLLEVPLDVFRASFHLIGSPGSLVRVAIHGNLPLLVDLVDSCECLLYFSVLLCQRVIVSKTEITYCLTRGNGSFMALCGGEIK